MAKTVSVTLTANTSGFTAALTKAGSVAKSTATGIQSSMGKALDGIDKNSGHIDTLGGGFLKVGAAAALGVGLAVKKFADFDQSMSLVAASGQDARDNLDSLRKAAIDAGASTAFSATEAAGGIESLAKAGVSAQDTLGGGLKGALDLAAAGNLDVAGSAEAAATMMTQFGLSGKDVPHIADLLAAAAGKAQGEVSDFAGAMNQSGLVASQFGLSIEETTGTLAAFASAGLLGSDAGTSFKTMLLRLANPSKEAAATMKELGINAYDAQGQFVGIESLAGQLQKSMGGLSDAQRDAALSTIFGSDAIRAANVLYQQGAAGIAQWTANVDDAGFAAETAAIRMDNLKGDIEQFTGSLETAFIGAGSGGNDFLRDLTQGATDLVNKFNQMPASVQEGSLRILALGAGAALAIGGLAKLAVGVAATRTALTALGLTATVTRAKLAALNGGTLLAVAGFVAVQAASAAMTDQLDKNSVGIDGYQDSLSKLGQSQSQLDGQFGQFGSSFALLGQGIGDTATAFEALADTQNFVSQGFRKVGDALGMASTAGILADEFDKIDKSLTQMDPDQAAEAFRRLSDQASAAGLTSAQIASTFDDYKKKQDALGVSAAASFRQSEIAFRNGAGAVKDYGTALDVALVAVAAINPAMKRTAEQSGQLASSLFAQGDAFQNSVTASSAYQAAIDEANTVLDKNGVYVNKSKTALKDGAAAGRENIGVLNSLASSGKAYVQSLITQGVGADKAADATRKVRGEFIAAARDAGLGGEAAKQLADDYGLIPSKVSTTVEAFGLAIQAEKVEAFKTALNALPAEQKARIISIFEKDGAEAAQNALAAIKDKEVIAKATAVGTDDVKGMDTAMKSLKDRLVEAKARGDDKGVRQIRAAMASLKDRQVIARSKGDLKGAKDVKSAMAALRDRLVHAKSRGDESGAKKIRAAMAALRDKTVWARTRADTSGASRASDALGNIRDKTVYIRLKEVKMKAEGGPVFRSNGGPVWGAGTATSDSIDAKLSNGEYVIKAASVRLLGLDRLHHMNATGTVPKFKDGGPVGFAAGGRVDINFLYRLIAQLRNPMGELSSLTGVRTTRTRENTAAQRELAAARANRRRVYNRRNETAADRKKVNDALARAQDKAKAATDRLADANANLANKQREVADTARAMSTQFQDAYRTTSTDARDWISLMQQGSTDIVGFTNKIVTLRKQGLNETLVQQIIGMGAVAGSELATQISGAGGVLVGQLNKANAALEKAADNLGFKGTTTTGRVSAFATGGLLSGPGHGTSDSMTIRASTGEYVVNAAATSRHLPLLHAINYGARTSHPNYGPGYATGGVVQRRTIDPGVIAQAVEAGLSRASFTGYIDGQPFKMIVQSELRQRGRQGARTR